MVYVIIIVPVPGKRSSWFPCGIHIRSDEYTVSILSVSELLCGHDTSN